jgi:purine-cytosine permease-like protein
MISTTGWNAINSISGASVLAALSNGRCPQWAGVIIICTVVWIICVLGITWIHRFDAFFWIAPFIAWCVAAGVGAPHFHGDAVKSPGKTVLRLPCHSWRSFSLLLCLG